MMPQVGKFYRRVLPKSTISTSAFKVESIVGAKVRCSFYASNGNYLGDAISIDILVFNRCFQMDDGYELLYG